MEWTFGFTLVFIGACLTAALLVTNVFIAGRSGDESYRVTAALHIVGILTAAGNFFRVYGNASGTTLAANAVVIFTIAASLRRCVLRQKTERK